MGTFQWKKEYEIGDELIDSQHKKILIVINELIENYHVYDLDKSYILFEKLLNHSLVHFSSEENLMKRIKFPEIREHIKEHNEFKKMIQTYKEEIDLGHVHINYNMMIFLNEWLTNHILISDKEISSYL